MDRAEPNEIDLGAQEGPDATPFRRQIIADTIERIHAARRVRDYANDLISSYTHELEDLLSDREPSQLDLLGPGITIPPEPDPLGDPDPEEIEERFTRAVRDYDQGRRIQEEGGY